MTGKELAEIDEGQIAQGYGKGFECGDGDAFKKCGPSSSGKRELRQGERLDGRSIYCGYCPVQEGVVCEKP